MSAAATTAHAADRLLEAVDRAGAPACIGVDPVLERVPEALRPMGGDPLVSIGAFCSGLLDAVAPHVPCVKFQSACFERYGGAGVDLLRRQIEGARARGLVAILDAKRGDIGISAEHYAEAAFGAGAAGDGAGGEGPEWITVSAYFGADGIAPFLVEGRGAFALVRTSNPGGDALQRRRLEDGRTVAECVADLVAEAGSARVGARGYSALGAVVGATKADEAAALRARMPQQVLLVPGYGAQGATAADLRPFFAGGAGAIVSAGRSVIYPDGPAHLPWPARIAEAAKRFAGEIASAAGG